jgi:hypothetical protein
MPPPFVADSEEIVSRITCELLVIDTKAEREIMLHKKSFLHNSAVGNESDSLRIIKGIKFRLVFTKK